MKKICSLAVGFVVLVTIYFVSMLICKVTHFAFPPALLGLMILALLLAFKILDEKFVKDICELLLNNMTLFFVPLLVGVVTYTNLISKNLTAILVTIFVSTFLTMILTAFFVQITIKYTTKDKSL